jgi:tetratricopeptide (TPR) repeat protein
VRFPAFVAFKVDQAEVEGNHGDALLKLGKLPEAQKEYLESLKHVKEFFAKHPDDIENQPLLALANERLGIVSLNLKKEAEAKDYFRAAMQLRKELWEIEKSNLSRQIGFVVSMARAGDVPNAMRLGATLKPRMEKSTELMLQVARCFAICAGADVPEKKKNIEQALSALTSATSADYMDATALLTDPDLSMLREEPAFKELIAKIRMR